MLGNGISGRRCGDVDEQTWSLGRKAKSCSFASITREIEARFESSAQTKEHITGQSRQQHGQRLQVTTTRASKDNHHCWIRIRPGLGVRVFFKRPSSFLTDVPWYQLVERTSMNGSNYLVVDFIRTFVYSTVMSDSEHPGEREHFLVWRLGCCPIPKRPHYRNGEACLMVVIS